jgi:MYXO-CTERM domain-containing protein
VGARQVSRSIALAAATFIALSASAVAAQQPLDRAGFTLAFPGFGATGFAPSPSAGALDSDLIIPYGLDGAPPFGGTCTTPTCAHGMTGLFSGLLPGVWAVGPLSGFVATPGVGLQAGVPGGTFHPGGLRWRFVNTDASSLRTAILEVRWAKTGFIPNDLHVRFLPGCDLATLPVPLVVDIGSTSGGGGPWTAVDETFVPMDLNTAPGAEGCFEFDIGEGLVSGSLGLTALFAVRVDFPPAVCGDGLVETGEDCEPIAGPTPTPCSCDASCLFPSGNPCPSSATNPCVGACSGGHCTPFARTDDFPIMGCDNGIFCDGAERCFEGVCSTVPDSACSLSGECLFCDEVLDVCGASVPGCCNSDDDCVGPCGLGMCSSHMCRFDRTCDAGPLPDASFRRDASVPSDGALTSDGSTGGPDGAALDGGSPNQDAGNVAFDAGDSESELLPGFGGGGGCRCAAAGRGPSGVPALGLGVLVALALQRRRRTHESARALSGTLPR